MEKNSHSHSHSKLAGENVTSAASSAAIGGAKYKLIPPACITISRAASIPSLESPVLISNIKAEPSPTTGSFSKLQPPQGSGRIAASLLMGSSSNTYRERNSSFFEFKFAVGSSSASGSLATERVISTGSNHQQNEPLKEVQDQSIPQSLALSSLAEREIGTSNELSLSSPFNVGDSSKEASVSAPVYTDTMNSRDKSYPSMHGLHVDHKDVSSVTAERSSEDGYNWRKYGQKLVKGSEFPRSYYKCTYPNCEVKKIFEQSPEGQITEIVYKGSHDHPKPQLNRRFSPGSLMPIQEDKCEKEAFFRSQEDKLSINAHHSKIESSSTPVSPQQLDADGLEPALPLRGTNDEMDEDDAFAKRRKMDSVMDIIPVVKPIREPRVVVQTLSEIDILDDGYRWRKYGQKVVRGNPNPRSYYKCTNAGCPVRKHVERASHDPKAVITTYEAKHNHGVPTARINNHETSGSMPATGSSRIRPEVTDSISLDLGVGTGYSAENRNNGKLHAVHSQVQLSRSSVMVVQPCYGIVNGGMSLFGALASHVQGPGFETLPLSATQCPQNYGKILFGP